MYRKVHLRLTALCAGITAALMIVMSLCYLYISETSLYRNQYNSFKNDINTIATNLEQQSVISMEWLSKMEAQGNYAFLVLDNDIPFLYNQLTRLSGSPGSSILQEGLDFYRQNFEVKIPEIPSSPYLSRHREYRFQSPSEGKYYFGSVICVEKKSSLLQVVIISPLDLLEKQISQQRIRFLLIDMAAILLFVAFSWIFTGILLKPIQENQRKQTRFIAAASHELRTPLAVILSSVECFQNVDHGHQEIFLETIHQEGLRMSRLIEDMLTLTESDNHRFSIQKEPVELDTLLLNTCEAFEPLAKENGLSLSLILPDKSLPTCVCDPDRIRQVVSILLHNAVSYTPEHGKVRMSLSLKDSPHGKSVFLISVSDNGIGISDEDKKKIFDRFYRAEKARSTRGHFGLGLSIACEIVSAHHGTIAVSDSPEGGSLFTVSLPEK